MPIIVFTATAEAEAKRTGVDLGVDDFLVKPTTPGELLPLETSAVAKELLPADLDPAAAQPGAPPLPSPGCTLIALLGARGGAGTTITAINLAAALGDSGQPTTLIDLDSRQGHIALYLNRNVHQGLNNLALPSGPELSRRVPGMLQSEQTELRLLLAEPNLDGELPVIAAEQVPTLLAPLCRPGQALVVDLGRGLSRPGRALLARTTHVFLCLRPERISLASGRHMVRQLRAPSSAGDGLP